MTKKRETKQERLTHPFIVDAIERQDLIGLGYNEDEVLGIKNSQMKGLAYTLGKSIDTEYWMDIIDDFAKTYGIRKSDE